MCGCKIKTSENDWVHFLIISYTKDQYYESLFHRHKYLFDLWGLLQNLYSINSNTAKQNQRIMLASVEMIVVHSARAGGAEDGISIRPVS